MSFVYTVLIKLYRTENKIVKKFKFYINSKIVNTI